MRHKLSLSLFGMSNRPGKTPFGCTQRMPFGRKRGVCCLAHLLICASTHSFGDKKTKFNSTMAKRISTREGSR